MPGQMYSGFPAGGAACAGISGAFANGTAGHKKNRSVVRDKTV